MKIKITGSNMDRIVKALENVNGRAFHHAYTHYCEIQRLVTAADERLATLRLSKKEARGMRLRAISGAPVPSAYTWPRKATYVEITLCPTGWCLTEIKADTVYAEGGSLTTILTEEQAQIAQDKFRKDNYIVATGAL
jgi:hypothetical protein